jgi:subtilisin family serine protease
MLLWLAGPAMAGTSAFYPGRGPEMIALDPDGTVQGLARTGEVLVHADDPASLASAPGVGAVVVLRGHVARITPVIGVDDVALSVALRQRPDVQWSHPDLRVRLETRSLPDDPYLADQWHLRNTGQQGFTPGVDIGASEAWDITHGAGEIVAILDSGVDLEHPDLSVIDGHDYVGDDDSSDAVDEAHGTACAGLAVGIGNNGLGTAGVAYEGTAYAIRIVGNSTLSELYDGFAEAVDAGASVLSNSWGFEDDCSGVPDYGVIEDAILYAEENGRGGKGAAVVFAAGNGNCDIQDNGMLAHPEVITVAAVNGFDVREGYSAFGAWVDIAAPSGGMYTTDMVGAAGYNGYPGDDDYTTWFNGTSASTPVVSGTVALMFASNARLTAADARDALCDTAVRLDLDGGAWDLTGWSPYYGCGRVHAGAAVRAVANLGPPEAAAGTVVEMAPESAFLTWDAASDPDGDALAYTIRWWRDPDDVQEVETDRTWLDLTGEVADGDTVTWTIQAADLWGPGPESTEQVTAVVAPPPAPVAEETGGCTHVSGGPGWLAAAALLLRRRATSPGSGR